MSEDVPRAIPDPLPDHPDLDWLRKQAKRHLKTLRNVNPAAQLADAQFALAEQYGFSSWRALKAHVDNLTVDPIVSAALEQAERSAPLVKAAALFHIARVVNAFDHDEAERVLERGFTAADLLREPERSAILAEEVSPAATVSPERALELARSLESDEPSAHICRCLGVAPVSKALFGMMSHGHTDSAVAYLTSTAASEDYPFDVAIEALGRSKDDARRLQLLRRAVLAARGQTASGRHGVSIGSRRQFPFLFTRWWRLLPADEAASVVRDLVQRILAEPDLQIRAQWSGVRFSSIREHRLFEILAPLRHLEPALAESLVLQYPQLAAASARYPYGQESIAAAPPHGADRDRCRSLSQHETQDIRAASIASAKGGALRSRNGQSDVSDQGAWALWGPRRDVQSFSKARMEAAPVEIDRDLVDLLEELHRPAKQAARELIVLELYRQGEVSSGRAAQLLGKERAEFIRYASEQGIPYFQLDADELQRELNTLKTL